MNKLVYIHNFIKTEEDSYRSIHGCDVCSYGSKSAFFMLNHVKRHHLPVQLFDCSRSNVELYYCRNCNINFDNIVDLRSHITKVHFLKEERERNNFTGSCAGQFNHVKDKCSPDTIQRKLPANKSEKINSYVKNVKRGQTQDDLHQAKHTNDKNMRFKRKKWSSKSRKKLKKKVLQQVKESHSMDKDRKWFQCGVCTYKSSRKDLLRRHIRCKHTEDKDKLWFYCDMCTFKSYWKNVMKRHIIRKHTDSKDIPWLYCDKCTYKSIQKCNIKKHIAAKHTDDEDKTWLCCDKCRYKTIDKCNINRHFVANHKDDKDKRWFYCDKCTHKTNWKADLKKHIVVKHTDDKDKTWFYCDECTFKSIRKSKVKEHFTVKHSELWFYCDKCTHKTKRKGCLKKHIVVKHINKQR